MYCDRKMVHLHAMSGLHNKVVDKIKYFKLFSVMLCVCCSTSIIEFIRNVKLKNTEGIYF